MEDTRSEGDRVIDSLAEAISLLEDDIIISESQELREYLDPLPIDNDQVLPPPEKKGRFDGDYSSLEIAEFVGSMENKNTKRYVAVFKSIQVSNQIFIISDYKYACILY
jgi:hypothetical protein